MDDQNDMQDLAEKLRKYTVPMLLSMSKRELEAKIDEVLPAVSRTQKWGIKMAIWTRLSPQGNSNGISQQHVSH